MELSPESERVLNHDSKPLKIIQPAGDSLEITDEEISWVEPIQAVNRKRILKEKSNALVDKINKNLRTIDIEDQQCYPLECSTFRRYFFPALRLLCIGGFLVVSLFILTCFYIENPPIDPMISSYYFAVMCMAGLGLDVIINFYLEVMKGQCSMKFLVNCLFHHICTMACLFSPLIGNNREFYILMYVVFQVDINTFFLKVRTQLNRNRLPYKIVNFIFYFSWFFLRLILVPICTGYFWYLWAKHGYYFDLRLNAAIQCSNLIALYIIWTYNLLNKLSDGDNDTSCLIHMDMEITSTPPPPSSIST